MLADDLNEAWPQRLARHAQHEKPWLIIPSAPESSSDHRLITFRDLQRLSHHTAVQLSARGGPVAQRMVVVADNSTECCLCIMAALLLGLTIVAIAPPAQGQARATWRAQVDAVLGDCAPAMLVGGAHDLAGEPERAGCSVATFAELIDWDAPTPALPIVRREQETVLWQYTSGTTGGAKIAQISRANLAHNIAAIGRRVQIREDDVNTIWLPLFHDMGMIGSLLFAAYWGISGVLMSPRMFAARPHSWLWAISRFRVTLSAAPNAAYEICATRLEERKLTGLDLSSWRVAFNGAECVHRRTVESFVARYVQYGLRETAIYPVYGLAEHTLAAAMPDQSSGAAYDWVDAAALESSGRAQAVAADQPGAQPLTSVGSALPGHEIRIVSPETGDPAPERLVGRIELRGPSCMLGYRGVEPARARDEWLDTGDLGYLAAGQLYVVGRSKHVIKRGGRSISAELIEASVRAVDGVRGVVAAFGTTDEAHGTERIIVLAESGQAERDQRERIRQAIMQAVRATVSCAPDEVQLVQPGAIPRTTSGKVKHVAARRAFLEGRYHA